MSRREEGRKRGEKGKEGKGDESNIGVECLIAFVGACTLLRLDSDFCSIFKLLESWLFDSPENDVATSK